MAQYATNPIAGSADSARAGGCFDAKTVLVPGTPWPMPFVRAKPDKNPHGVLRKTLSKKQRVVFDFCLEQKRAVTAKEVEARLGVVIRSSNNCLTSLAKKGVLMRDIRKTVIKDGRVFDIAHYTINNYYFTKQVEA